MNNEELMRIREDKRLQEVKLLTELFLKTRKSDIELAEMTGISSSNVQRRLNDVERMKAVFGINEGIAKYNEITKLRQENKLHGKILGGEISRMNNSDNGQRKLRLDIFYSKREEQMKFLLHLMLTFRLKFKTVEELFGYSKEELDEAFRPLNIPNRTFQFLEFENYNQTLAKNQLIFYYKNYLDSSNKEERAKLIYEVLDDKVLKIFKENRVPGETISEEVLSSLIKYQLKYGLSDSNIADMFNIHRSNYTKKANKYVENKKALLQRRENLVDYIRIISVDNYNTILKTGRKNG